MSNDTTNKKYNKISYRIEEIGTMLKDKVVDGVTSAVVDTVEDKLSSSIEEISSETVPKRDIESN